MLNEKHEPNCWTGKVEYIALHMEPAYTPDFDDSQPCLECMDIRAEKALPNKLKGFKLKLKGWFRRALDLWAI